jgi:hypothetical protein
MFDTIGETELQVEGEHLVVAAAFLGIEALELPSYVSQHQTHLEGRVGSLVMCADVGTKRKRRV